MVLMFGVSILKLCPTRSLNRLYKISTNHNVIQLASMTRLAYKEPVVKPAPFPYWEKNFAYCPFHQQLFEPTTFRFDENTRLVVVDGPPAVGKTKFCEYIANEFGLLYMPPPEHEDLYVDMKGYDMRELDPQLPLLCRSFTLKNFLENPNDIRANSFQVAYSLMRMEQYLIALLHLMSTGQGVVLNRCVYSDIVFAEAMCKSGYITNDVLTYCKCVRRVADKFMLRPHLIIYLDAPVKLVQEKIQQRNRPDEIKSKVLNSKFLGDLENAYKEKYLKKLVDHTPLLIYDWSVDNDYSYIVEDIESINFDDNSDGRLDDWVFNAAREVNIKRVDFSKVREFHSAVVTETAQEDYLMPEELYPSASDRNAANEVYSKYHYTCEDTRYENLSFIQTLLKTKNFNLCLIRRTSRDLVNYNIPKIS